MVILKMIIKNANNVIINAKRATEQMKITAFHVILDTFKKVNAF
jgi:hypothetical protein